MTTPAISPVWQQASNPRGSHPSPTNTEASLQATPSQAQGSCLQATSSSQEANLSGPKEALLSATQGQVPRREEANLQGTPSTPKEGTCSQKACVQATPPAAQGSATAQVQARPGSQASPT